MGRLIVSSLASLDGVHGDPRRWAGPYFDHEATDKSIARLEASDAMLMGRGAYDYFAPAWSASSGPYTDRLNAIKKYVFSSTLTRVDWSNAELVTDDLAPFVGRLKRQGSGHLIVYGYTQLARSLLEAGLVDELELWIHPIVVGSGAPLHRDGPARSLKLAGSEVRANGVVSLTYTEA